MKKIINAYNEIEEKLLVISMVISIVVLFINVVLRKAFNSSLFGSDEIARIMFIWMSWLGISLAERKNQHVTIDVLTEKLSGTPKKVVAIISDIITAVLLVTLFITSYFVTMEKMAFGSVTPMFQIPSWIMPLAMLVGCGIMGIRVITKLIKTIKNDPIDESRTGGCIS